MKYKVILGFLILINIFTTVYPMIGKSKYEIHQENESSSDKIRESSNQIYEIERMDKEIIRLFFIELIRSYINNYNDIFALYEGEVVKDSKYKYKFIYKFDQDLRNKMINVPLVCKKFNNVFKEYAQDLENAKSQLKKERCNYLREEIKSNYEHLTTDELNSQLAIILDKLIEDEDIEIYKEGIKLILAGADAVKIENKKGYNFLIYVSQRRLWMPLLTEIYSNREDWGMSNRVNK